MVPYVVKCVYKHTRTVTVMGPNMHGVLVNQIWYGGAAESWSCNKLLAQTDQDGVIYHGVVGMEWCVRVRVRVRVRL